MRLLTKFLTKRIGWQEIFFFLFTFIPSSFPGSACAAEGFSGFFSSSSRVETLPPLALTISPTWRRRRKIRPTNKLGLGIGFFRTVYLTINLYVWEAKPNTLGAMSQRNLWINQGKV